MHFGAGDGVVDLGADAARLGLLHLPRGFARLVRSAWESEGGLTGLATVVLEPGRQQVANAVDAAAEGDFRTAAASGVKALSVGVTTGFAMGELGAATVAAICTSSGAGSPGMVLNFAQTRSCPQRTPPSFTQARSYPPGAPPDFTQARSCPPREPPDFAQACPCPARPRSGARRSRSCRASRALLPPLPRTYLSPAGVGATVPASPASLAVCPGRRVEGLTLAARSALPAIRRSPVKVVAPQPNSSS